MDKISIQRDHAFQALAIIAHQLSGARSHEDYLRVMKIIHDQADMQLSRALVHSGKTLVCKAGCSFCCHKKVDLIPLEVFRIVEYLRKNFSEEEVNAVRKRAAENSKKIKQQTLAEQLSSNTACPLLKDGKCSVYPVRPLSCRRDHSQKVENCEALFNDPDSNPPDDRLAELQGPIFTLIAGAQGAMSKLGFDAHAYDLSHAVLEALDNPKSIRRWRQKKRAFPRTAIAKDWDDNIDTLA